MKTLVKWAIKKFATKDALKAAIHAANAKIAETQASDRAAKVMEYGNDASDVTAAYLAAFAGDGTMDAAEQAACDAVCDKMVDKYLGDDAIERCVDAIFG